MVWPHRQTILPSTYAWALGHCSQASQVEIICGCGPCGGIEPQNFIIDANVKPTLRVETTGTVELLCQYLNSRFGLGIHIDAYNPV